MDRVRQIKLLLAMAAADGSVSPEELRLLGDRSEVWGVDPDQMEEIIAEACSGDVSLDFPEDRGERRELLKELLRMMGADGRMHHSETGLFAALAARLEISADEVNQIIDDLTR